MRSKSNFHSPTTTAPSHAVSSVRDLTPCPPRLPFPPRRLVIDPPKSPPDPVADAPPVPVASPSSPTSSKPLFPLLTSSVHTSTSSPLSASTSDDEQLVHDSVHTGGQDGDARNYVCTMGNCHKAFHRKSDLQRHHRIHTNERPYACQYPQCGKAFIQRSALTVHYRTHTGERPHICEACHKAFADSSSLARHRRTHTGNRPYICKVEDCEKPFARRNTFLKHYKRQHPDLPPPPPSIPRTRSSAPPAFSKGALNTASQLYLPTPSTGPPHGFVAPHPPEDAAHPNNGGQPGHVFGGGSTVHPHFAFAGSGTFRGFSYSNTPGQANLTPLSASTTSSFFADSQQQEEESSTAGISGTNGASLRRPQSQLSQQGSGTPVSGVSIGAGAYPHHLGPGQYASYVPTSHPLTRFASDSGAVMYMDRSNLTAGARSVSSLMDYPPPPRYQAYLPGMNNAVGGFHASQLSIPPQHGNQLAPSYYEPGLYPQRSLSGRPIRPSDSPRSSDYNMEENDEPLIAIGDAPTFAVHPQPLPLPTVAYPISAVEPYGYTPNSHWQPQILNSPPQHDRLHSAPPALHRYNSLPAASTAGNWPVPVEPQSAHSIDGVKSSDEDWDNLLSREASVGEDSQLAPATKELKPPGTGDINNHWEAPIAYPVPPTRYNYRYPFSLAASPSSTSTTLVAGPTIVDNSTNASNPANTLPPITTLGNTLPNPLTPINPNGFYPMPARLMSGWNADLIKTTQLLPSPAEFSRSYPQPMLQHDQENDRSQPQDITLTTPPNKWHSDANKDNRSVAAVGLGIANVHFTDRSGDVVDASTTSSKSASTIKGPVMAQSDDEWEEGEEELMSPELDDDSDDDYVVGRKPKKTKRVGRKSIRGGVASKARRR